jgi:hypothetical protein
MVIWPPYPWYSDCSTNGVSNPYPWYIESPTHVILTSYQRYIKLSIHGILNPYPWYVDSMPILYQIYHGWEVRYSMDRGSKYHGDKVKIPWVGVRCTRDRGFDIIWAWRFPIHGILTSILMVYRTPTNGCWPSFPGYIKPLILVHRTPTHKCHG